MEDAHIFPDLKQKHPTLGGAIERLTADHRRIDPLLQAGDEAFAHLPGTEAGARAVVAQLTALLDAHLETEEAEIIPFLRAAKEFPTPANDEETAMFAQGFAWSSHGIADDVLERVYAALPPALVARLPAARAAFEARCQANWGSAEAGASHTSVPEP